MLMGRDFGGPRLIALIGAGLAALVAVPPFCNQGPVHGTVHSFPGFPFCDPAPISLQSSASCIDIHPA